MTAAIQKQSLTRHPTASFREMLTLAIPLIISLVSANTIVFIDRLFLSRYSLEAFEACAAAAGLFFLFQVTSLRFVTTIQAFVSHAMGSKRYDEANSYTWQMIWFSVLSPFVIVPIGLTAGYFFFKGTPIEAFGRTYFNYLIWGNILFVLEGTFGAYFAGIGRTRMILYIHLVTHAINVGLNYCLIFGINGVLPSLGLHGAAIGTLISKGLACLIFALYFIKFSGKNWMKIIPSRFMECIRKALPRAIGQGVAILAWNAAAHILIQKGGIDLLVCTFGVSVFLPLINDGMGFAFLSVSSYLIGSRNWKLFPKLMRSTGIFILFNALLISIPFLIYPGVVIQMFAHDPFSYGERAALLNTCLWVAFSYLTNSIYVTSFMLITAFKDTFFYMVSHVLLGSLTFYVPTLILAKQNCWKPEWFWLLNGFACLPFALIYFSRCYSLFKKQSLIPQSAAVP